MMTNLLFSQASALGKRLAMVLTMLLIVGIGQAWGEESLQVTLDFTSGNWEFPSGSSNKTYQENTYTHNGYSIKLAGGGNSNGHYFNTQDKYLLMGKSGATLTLPAFDFNTTKIVVTGKSGASGSVKQNIYVGSNAVSTETTGATGTNTYTINAANQAAGNVYILKVTSAHNTQITKIEVYGESNSSEPPTPTTQYTIKWHTAKGVTTDVTLNEGATITKPATDPTMSGYVFMGWTEDCEVASDGAGFIPITNFGTATEDKDYYAVFAKATTTGGGGGSTTESIFSEDFSSITGGNSTSTSGSGTAWNQNSNFYSVTNAYQAGGAVRIGTSKNAGTLVTKQLTAAVGETLTISFKVKGWSSVEGNIQVSGNNSEFAQPDAIKYTSIMSGSFETKTVSVVLTKANPYIKIATTAKRAFIDDIVITKNTHGAQTTTYSDYLTSCTTETTRYSKRLRCPRFRAKQ